MTASSKLQQLRATLEQLEAYDILEENNQQAAASGESLPVLDEELIRRFQECRHANTNKNKHAQFYSNLGAWKNNSVDFHIPTQEELQEVEAKRVEAQRKLSEKVAEVHHRTEMLRSEYQSFDRHREEYRRTIREIEAEERDEELSQDDDSDSMSQDVDEEEMAHEEQKLADLTQRKAEMEAELRRLQNETAQFQVSLEESHDAANQMKGARGATSSVFEPRAVSPETIVSSTEQIETEEVALQKKISQLREMSMWYGPIRDCLEEISAIKILQVENVPANGIGQDGVETVLRIELLDKYEIEVILQRVQKAASKKGQYQNHESCISSARFVTETLVSASCDEEQNHNGSVVQMRLPPLDDLVKISANLGPSQDLKFLLRETMSRIQTITARVEELALLQAHYLANIGKSSRFDHGFGGEDQEIVCNLNDRLTVVLKLSPDCPMVEGSVTVVQICGVGGWDQCVLEDMRKSVNARPCKGPMALMDFLVKEIERLEEEGVVFPGTPSMPTRGGAYCK